MHGRAWLIAPLFLAAAGLLAIAGLVCAPAGAAPMPPTTGDWIIDTGEVVNISATNLTVNGNITLNAAAELHLSAVRLAFGDADGKRALTGPSTSLVTIDASSLSAAVGPSNGGFGYYIHVDGVLTLSRSSVTGLSGPTVPNPFGETEGIHLTSSASSVTNCTIAGAQGYAVTVGLGATLTTVTPTIADNLIRNNGGGVFLSGLFLARADARIERNGFSFNTFPHIVVSGSNPLIEGNTLFGSTAGITVFAGSPRIANNTFLANLIVAVSVTSGGGIFEDNSISATGVAFLISSSSVTIRRNNVTLSATGLQATDATVTFEDNRVSGAFGTALIVNGTTLTARATTADSALGSPALRGTNGSTVTLYGGGLSSDSGSGIVFEGGALTVDGTAVRSLFSPLTATGTAVALRNATFTGGGSTPVLVLTRGSLDATGGRISGGADGLLLDNTTASLGDVAVTGNSLWGIHAIHRTPDLSPSEVNLSIHGNGKGDLLVEADLTVNVVNRQGEPVPGVDVSITDVAGATTVSGVSAADGRVGPVRLASQAIDSLNNRVSYSPYAVRASLPSGWRASALAPLVSDLDVTVTLEPNSAPVVEVIAPASVRVSTAFTAVANASDAEGDALTYRWTTDDGRSFSTREATLAFDAAGNHSLTVVVSDGFLAVTVAHRLTVLTAAQANRLPVFPWPFLPIPVYGLPYDPTFEAEDPDGDLIVFYLQEGALGMTLRRGQSHESRAALFWDYEKYFPKTRDAQNLTFEVRIEAFDGYGSSYLVVNVTLFIPADLPPVWKPLPDQNMTAGDSVTLELSDYLSDPDHHVSYLSFRLTVNGTDRAVLVFFGTRTAAGIALVIAALHGQPAGAPPIEVTITAFDPPGRDATITFLVRVTDGSSAPQAEVGVGSLLVPSLIAMAAVGIAVWAAFTANRASRRQEPPKTP